MEGDLVSNVCLGDSCLISQRLSGGFYNPVWIIRGGRGREKMLKKQKAELPAQELSLTLGSQFWVGTTKMEGKDCFSGLFQELPKGEAFVQGK